MTQKEIKAYNNTDFPIRSKDLNGNPEEHSVDVITSNESGMLNIGFYNFDMKKWMFHTDTLTDPYEGGKLENFIWIYPPRILNLLPY